MADQIALDRATAESGGAEQKLKEKNDRRLTNRRRHVRYYVTSEAEVVEPQTRARITGRATDVGGGGCYVDTTSPLPVGTTVQIRLTHEEEIFQSRAIVRNSITGMGMGLQFLDVSADQAEILARWIADRNNLMLSLDQPEADLISQQELDNNLRLLDRSIAWCLWSGAAGFVLLLGAIALLSPPRSPGMTLLVRGLLCFVCAVNIATLFWYRHLKVLRKRLVSQMEFVAKQRARANALYGLSILDPLTGLYNRRYGEHRLREEIARAERSGDPLLLLALDFDRFKAINDQNGHAVGDMALKTFSRRLQRAVRACDVPIRVGGDEFLVILPECSPDKAQLILSRVYPVEVNVEGKKIPISFSYGITQYQINDAPETMIGRADEQLYAKKAKRAVVELR